MRKRSRYRPKGVRLDTMGYAIESMKPVTQHESFALDLRLKNHLAFTLLKQGTATREDMDVVIAALNITESLWRLGHGKDYRLEVDAGLRALRAVATRGIDTNCFAADDEELLAIDTALGLHDAQLDVITVKDMEKALFIVHEEIRNKRATPIKETKT